MSEVKQCFVLLFVFRLAHIEIQVTK